MAKRISRSELEKPLSCVYLKFYIDKAADDRFLTEVIHPLVRRELESGRFKTYFFLRYQDPGYHIRLRLFGSKASAGPKQKARLTDEITAAVSAFAQIKTVPDRYLPEYKRYGRKYGVRVSERIFEASSAAVLEFMALKAKTPKLSKLEFAVSSTEAIFNGLMLKPAEREQTIQMYSQFGPDAFAQLEKQFAPEVMEALQMAVTGARKNPVLHWKRDRGNAEVASIVDRLEKKAEEFRSHLKQVVLESKVPTTELASSYYHMHLNRLALFPAEEVLVRAFSARKASASKRPK
jgi:lantibiotic biosynthesis protein